MQRWIIIKDISPNHCWYEMQRSVWCLDVNVTSNPYLVDHRSGHSTTGGVLWKAAQRLVDFFSNSKGEYFPPGCTVLELGAGLGYLGLTISRNTPSGLVCLTEQEEGLEWLRVNAESNKHLPNSKAVRVCACDWRDHALYAPQSNRDCHPCSYVSHQEQQHQQHQQQQMEADQSLLTSTHWDYIVGSDLVYNEVGSRMLPLVLKRFCSPSTVVLYCHTKHRFDHLDIEFFEQLESVGFTVKEVREPGSPSPPPSPPPLTELFPEQRIAVYQMSLRQLDPDV